MARTVSSPPGARASLARFRFTGGRWLIFLEITGIPVAWTFNFDFAHYLLAGVIWVIGCSMLALATLVWLPLWAIGIVGGVIVAGHNLLDPIVPGFWEGLAANPLGWLSNLAYLGAGGPPRPGAVGRGDGAGVQPTLLPQYDQVSRLAALPAHDAGPNDPPAAAAGIGDRMDGADPDRLRSGAAVLLPAA